MGDRANIVVTEAHAPAPIYLYSHWGGFELHKTLASALARGKGRWTDAPYLTRIIFNEMTKGSEMEETGYGISTQMGDNGHPLLVVDIDKQVVRVAPEGALNTGPEVPFGQVTTETLSAAGYKG